MQNVRCATADAASGGGKPPAVAASRRAECKRSPSACHKGILRVGTAHHMLHSRRRRRRGTNTPPSRSTEEKGRLGDDDLRHAM